MVLELRFDADLVKKYAGAAPRATPENLRALIGPN
jgi:hypothetical protein